MLYFTFFMLNFNFLIYFPNMTTYSAPFMLFSFDNGLTSLTPSANSFITDFISLEKSFMNTKKV